MHKVKFYPVGNGDCSQIILANGKRLLFDYCHRGLSEDPDDPRIDLATTLRQELAEVERDAYDVVGFTHLDDDHVCGSTEFFYFEHAAKYQSDDRIKIRELWVPAAILMEKSLTGEKEVLRQEARYRLKNGRGIRVFSKPEKLTEWLESEGLTLESRRHLITDAGQIVPAFEKQRDGVEFFVHSPFSKHCDGDTVQRNEAALILHATFLVDQTETRYLMIGDSEWEVLADIVTITRSKNRGDRLKWDIYNIPHHCSYLALGPDKGKEKTEPVDQVQWLLDWGQQGCILISSSDPIPTEDTDCPPHRQAARTYRDTIYKNGGDRFEVTMEHPNTRKPKPIVIEIDRGGAKLIKTLLGGSFSVTSKPSPRAG
jgi:hypothetical protein